VSAGDSGPVRTAGDDDSPLPAASVRVSTVRRAHWQPEPRSESRAERPWPVLWPGPRAVVTGRRPAGWCGRSGVSLNLVSQTHWKPRSEPDIELYLVLSESRDSQSGGRLVDGCKPTLARQENVQ
jgi:hypothetical protein